MYPVLTTFEAAGHVHVIGSYGVLLACALVLGGGLALRLAARAQLDSGALIAALGTATATGFAGAFALYAAVGSLQGMPLMAAAAHPGGVFYGGFVLALAGFALAARGLGLPVARTLDVITPAIPLAHALGRIGCFLGGCCFGAASSSPLAVTYRDPRAPAAYLAVARHPWPLYEAAALLLLALAFAALRAREPRSAEQGGALGEGALFASYVIAYALVRALLEPLRGDALRGVLPLGLSTSQLCAALLVCAALPFARARVRCT